MYNTALCFIVTLMPAIAFYIASIIIIIYLKCAHKLMKYTITEMINYCVSHEGWN